MIEQYDTQTQHFPQQAIISHSGLSKAIEKLKYGQHVQQLPQQLQMQNITIPQQHQQCQVHQPHVQIHQQPQFEIHQNPQQEQQNPILNVNIPHELYSYMSLSGTERIPTKFFNHYFTIIHKVHIFIFIH